MPRLYALILSGGAGTRLWPLSRRDKPKQFLPLTGERTLLQDTVDRVVEFIPLERIFAVAPPEHRLLIHEQLPELRTDHVVIEPYPRGNAAAEAGKLVTLGVEPESPDTGFGYIEAGDRLDLKTPLPVYSAKDSRRVYSVPDQIREPSGFEGWPSLSRSGTNTQRKYFLPSGSG